MKTMATMAILLVVLGFCLPVHGEILVYKLTQNGTSWEPADETRASGAGTWKGYAVIDVDYADNTITQAVSIDYERDENGKWFAVDPLQLELVRVEDGRRTQWIMLLKNLAVAGEEVTGSFMMAAGTARNRNVGTGENREVANTASGYVLWDTREGDRELGMSKISLTFYPAWTYWANREDEGNQDFDATVQMIKDYLTGKGYTEK
jgi:hypothetical protein